MILKRKRKRRRIALRAIPLKKGYDKAGKYWGEGQPLFIAEDIDTGHGSIFRASNRAEAIKKIGCELGNGFKRKL